MKIFEAVGEMRGLTLCVCFQQRLLSSSKSFSSVHTPALDSSSLVLPFCSEFQLLLLLLLVQTWPGLLPLLWFTWKAARTGHKTLAKLYYVITFCGLFVIIINIVDQVATSFNGVVIKVKYLECHANHNQSLIINLPVYYDRLDLPSDRFWRTNFPAFWRNCRTLEKWRIKVKNISRNDTHYKLSIWARRALELKCYYSVISVQDAATNWPVVVAAAESSVALCVDSGTLK